MSAQPYMQPQVNKNNYVQMKGPDPFGGIDYSSQNGQKTKKIDIDVFGKKTPAAAPANDMA